MSAPSSDRNLLLGILALQMDFITRDALIEALHQWTLEKSRSLNDILASRGALDPADRIALDLLVDRHIARHGGDPRQSLSALDVEQPARSVFEPIDDPDVKESLSSLSSVVTRRIFEAAGDDTESWGAMPPDADSRFQILRLHDQGGLGIVYLARDREVKREVALKQLNEACAADPQSRARFVLEAEITGNLEHPGIVPVYGMGKDALGRPYYAMRFVKGETFKEAVEHFHHEPALRVDEAARQREFQKLLRRFLTVCETMEYAHSRGIIHRDLKPRNILLGPYGETLVVDWGLAKVVGHGESELPVDATLRPPSSGEIDPTLAGSLLGTAAFMSPEQARGEVAAMGPATDVYGLGATLYVLLTGRAPFDGSNKTEIIRLVQRGECPPPRDVKPTVDRALNAICCKAMALDPGNRYASARLLSEDLERWLADQAIGAFQDGAPARIARWMRHHRAWTRAGAAALLLIAVVSSVAWVALERSWSFEHQAFKKEQVARSEADSNFAMAREAVNKLLTKLAEGQLAGVPEAEGLRRQVAEDAADFNERFLRMRPRDPAVRRGAAEIFREVANIYRLVGMFPEAVAAYEKSVEVLEKLVADFPADPTYRDMLAETLNDAAEDMRMEGRPHAGEPYCRRALEVTDRLLDEMPGSIASRKTKAGELNVLAMILLDTGRIKEANAALEKATALRGPLADAPASPYIDQLVFAIILHNWGEALRVANKSQQAEARLIDAIGRLTALRDGPLDSERLHGIDAGAIRDNATFFVAFAQAELGRVRSTQAARREDALRDLDAAIETLTRLVQRNSFPIRRKVLGLAYLTRGSLRNKEAEGDWNEVRRILEKLAEEFPHNATGQGSLARVLGQLGRLALKRGDRARARSLFQDALRRTQIALDANKESPEDLSNLLRLRKDLDAAGEPAAP